MAKRRRRRITLCHPGCTHVHPALRSAPVRARGNATTPGPRVGITSLRWLTRRFCPRSRCRRARRPESVPRLPGAVRVRSTGRRLFPLTHPRCSCCLSRHVAGALLPPSVLPSPVRCKSDPAPDALRVC